MMRESLEPLVWAMAESLDESQLEMLTGARTGKVTPKTNKAMNRIDKTAIRKKKRVAQEEQ